MSEYASSQSRGLKISVVRLGAQVVISTSLVQIQPYSLYTYGSVSGIGNAADCKSVASAFLVRVQGDPPDEFFLILVMKNNKADGERVFPGEVRNSIGKKGM